MKAAIYSPYLDTFGGGERYMLTIAELLSQHSFKVDVILNEQLNSLDGEYLKSELQIRFNLNLLNVNFIKGPLGKGSNFLDRFFFLKKYDVLFYLTDGSIFYPSSKQNILHVQSPLLGESAKSLWRKIKLNGWDLVIYNSRFTKQNSQKNWPISSEIIYPPVDVVKIKPLKKKKYILSVGRFFGYLKDKKHEILIKTFKEILKEDILNGWSLHLVGSAGDGDKKYLDELKNLAKGFPIKFYPNLGYYDLKTLYGESSIYWHASGYGENDPAKMEHFGISTCEAMTGGCVPVVIGKGGQVEIVDNKIGGFLWDNLSQLKSYTIKLIKDENLRKKMGKEAVRKSKDFSKENFRKKIMNIIT